MGNLLQKMTFSPQQTAPTFPTHHDPRGSAMPVQSSPEQPARPTPVAVAPLPSRQRHLLRVPEAAWADCGFGLAFFFLAKNPSGKKRQPLFVYADSQELPTGSLQPPAPLCNDSLGDMGRGRRGGENRGEESVTELLPRSAICPSLSAAGGSSRAYANQPADENISQTLISETGEDQEGGWELWTHEERRETVLKTSAAT